MIFWNDQRGILHCCLKQLHVFKSLTCLLRLPANASQTAHFNYNTTAQTCSLLNVPRELRDIVYMHYVDEDGYLFDFD
jgi:hypothetical protein